MARAQPMLAPMGASNYSDIKNSIRHLYLEDPRPWLVGFSGGKDSTMLASLFVEVVAGIPGDQRKKSVAILCTDTRVEIPVIEEEAEGSVGRIQRFLQQNNIGIEVNSLRPPPEQSFRVNMIGSGYPPPNRTFRWCTQRLKIDPVTMCAQQGLENARWSEAYQEFEVRSRKVPEKVACRHARLA